MRKLEGRVALVTGSGRNIGRAITLALAEQGAKVAVHGRTHPEAVEATAADARKRGIDARPFIADLSDGEAIRTMVADVREQLGPVEVLVSNAGIRPGSAFLEMAVEQWREVMAVNLEAAFHLCQAVIPHMLEVGRGSIVCLSGPAAFGGSPDRAHIAASKAGLIGLTKALAREFADRNIRANCIVPGTIDTEREHPEWYAGSDISSSAHLARVPMGRLGRPEEVAALCAFLATDDAAYITRQVLMVNGGAYL